MNRTYSIRGAARASGMTEERLRRAILEDLLVAHPVADDRQYLIDEAELRRFTGRAPAAEPAAKAGAASFVRSVVLPFLLFSAGLLTLVLLSRSRPEATVCLDCGAARKAEWVRGHCRTVPLPRAADTFLTRCIREAYPAPCRHDWGRPGQVTGGTSTTVDVLVRSGLLEAARKVDPRKAADLIRWALRNDIPADVARRWRAAASTP